MKANTGVYAIHPRVVRWMTQAWSYQDAEEMKNRNEGKRWWKLHALITIFIIALWLFPTAFLERNLVLCLLSSMILATAVLIYHQIGHIQYMRNCDDTWKTLKHEAVKFHKAMHIEQWEMSKLSYDQIVERARRALVNVAKLILTAEECMRSELRRILSEKFDMAKLCIGGRADNCRGYRFFYDMAHLELHISVGYSFEYCKNVNMVRIHFSEPFMGKLPRGHFTRDIEYEAIPPFVARLLAMEGITEVFFLRGDNYHVSLVKASLTTWNDELLRSVIKIVREEFFPLRTLTEMAIPRTPSQHPQPA